MQQKTNSQREFNIESYKKRMDGAISAFLDNLSSLRTDRARDNMLDTVVVSAYGSNTPLKQVATVSVAEARLLTVQVWDKSLVMTVVKAIVNSGLGLNPQVDGNILRIPIPALNEERRHEIVNLAMKYAEDARIAVRNVRRDGMEILKIMEKEDGLSKDEHFRLSAEVQTVTDVHIKEISSLVEGKKQEILKP